MNKKLSKQALKDSIIAGSGHGHICHPSQLAEITREKC